MGHVSMRAKLVLVVAVVLVAIALPASALAAPPTPGSISGKIVDRSTGQGIDQAYAEFFQVNNQGDWFWVGDQVTSPDGSYTMSNLDSGDYVIYAEDNLDPAQWRHEPRYYADTTNDASATVFPLGNGQDATIADIQLRPYAHISGHVTRKLTGADLSTITVSAVAQGAPGVWDVQLTTLTDAKGDFSLDFLLAGSYHVAFSDEATNYVDAMFHNIYSPAGTADYSVGTTITVVDGAVVDDIDQSMIDVSLYPFESTPPTTTASVDPDVARTAWSATDTALVTLTATDGPTGSGVESVWYATSEGGPHQSYSGPIHVTAEGASTIYFGAIDRWHNAEATQSVTVHLDRSAPSAWATIIPGASTWSVQLNATDANSGVQAIKYSLDGGAETTYTSAIVCTPGDHTVAYRAIDNVGNESATQTQTVGVRVRAVLSTPALSVKSPRHGKKFTITGTLTPSDPAPARVTLYIERKTRGKYKLYGRWNVTVPVGTPKYVDKLSLKSKGSYRVRAYHGADSVHTANYSSYRNFSVK